MTPRIPTCGGMLAVTSSFLLLAPMAHAITSITLDGIYSSADHYDHATEVPWFNGSQNLNKGNISIYGTRTAPTGTTTVRYGTGTQVGDTLQQFFLFVEVPLYAKNMIWQKDGKDKIWGNKVNGTPQLANTNPNSGLVEADVASYRIHHETHKNPNSMRGGFNMLRNKS